MSRLQQIATRRQALLAVNGDLVAKVTAIRENVVTRLAELLQRGRQVLEQKLAKVYTAEDTAEAAKIFNDLLGGATEVTRVRSHVLAEIGFDRQMAARQIRVRPTDLEEIVQKELGLPAGGHPRFLILDQASPVIEEGLRRFAQAPKGTAIPELKRLALAKIRKQILRSNFGITGADCVVAANGVLVQAEDEGNVRAVSNLSYKHIAVVGLEEIVESVEDALAMIRARYIFGNGRVMPNYVSLIAGPSRTGDIAFRMAYGIHGPKEVHVILLDNGRSAIYEKGAGDLLKCINCGACYESCSQWAEPRGWTGALMTPKGLALGLAQRQLSPHQAKAPMADFACPVGLTAKGVSEKLGNWGDIG